MHYTMITLDNKEDSAKFRAPEIGVRLEDASFFYKRARLFGFNAVLIKGPRCEATENHGETEDAAMMVFLGECGSIPWVGFSVRFDEFSGNEDHDSKFETVLKRHHEVIQQTLNKYVTDTSVAPPVPIERILVGPDQPSRVGDAYRLKGENEVEWRVMTGEGTTRKAQAWEIPRLNRYAAGWDNLQHRTVRRSLTPAKAYTWSCPEVGKRWEDLPYFFKRVTFCGFDSVLFSAAPYVTDGVERTECALMVFVGDQGPEGCPWYGRVFYVDEYVGRTRTKEVTEQYFEERCAEQFKLEERQLKRRIADYPVYPPTPIESISSRIDGPAKKGEARRIRTHKGVEWRVCTGDGTSREPLPGEMPYLIRYVSWRQRFKRRIESLFKRGATK